MGSVFGPDEYRLKARRFDQAAFEHFQGHQ